MVWGNRSTAMARTGRNGAPWTLLDGALHRLKYTLFLAFALLLTKPNCCYDLLDEVVHGCLGITRHIHKSLQMLRSPYSKYHFGIYSIQNKIFSHDWTWSGSFQLSMAFTHVGLPSVDPRRLWRWVTPEHQEHWGTHPPLFHSETPHYLDLQIQRKNWKSKTFWDRTKDKKNSNCSVNYTT